tara:strand:- start:1147 stop:1734 length:588 start_codon:yes stop_codon:yes gene_type:complete
MKSNVKYHITPKENNIFWATITKYSMILCIILTGYLFPIIARAQFLEMLFIAVFGTILLAGLIMQSRNRSSINVLTTIYVFLAIFLTIQVYKFKDRIVLNDLGKKSHLKKSYASINTFPMPKEYHTIINLILYIMAALGFVLFFWSSINDLYNIKNSKPGTINTICLILASCLVLVGLFCLNYLYVLGNYFIVDG